MYIAENSALDRNISCHTAAALTYKSVSMAEQDLMWLDLRC